MTVTLRPHQVEAVKDADRCLQGGAQNVCIVQPTGSGKCHGVDTPIMMYDGTIKMVQDVRVGDLLMGPDSEPREVLSLARGSEELYRVTPVKGEPYVVNESHILSLKLTGTDEIKNIPLTQWLSSSKTFKHTHKGWRTGVEFSKKKHCKYLPPYLLGVWLGDGSKRSPAITSADPEIVEYIHAFAATTGQDVRTDHMVNNASSNYHITAQRRRSNSTRQSLSDAGLIMNKHIPHEYKCSDRDDRLELLAGILDSDGYYSNGGYDIVQKIERFANDIVYLARSLGFAAYVKKCRKECTNTGVWGTYHRISISGDVSQIPTKLARHQAPVRKQKKSVLMTGIVVEPIGVGDYFGFEISGDHLYLLGDFTVTHNTILKAEYARRAYINGDHCFAFAHRDVLLSQISDAMCLMGVHHNFICSANTRRDITNANYTKFGNSFYDEGSTVTVVSVNTFAAHLKREIVSPELLASVKLWLLDETHHLTRGSIWGRCIEPLVNAIGIGVTATPIRGDRKGLGRHTDGYFDALSCTSSMAELIQSGKLTPYKIYQPTTKLDLSDVNVTAGGDYNQKKLVSRVDKREITGDAVEHYKRILPGKAVITFGVSIEHCEHVAKQFNEAGIPSKAVSSKTPLAERNQAIADLRNGILLNLVNCDLFSEGFDAPAVSGVIMLRPTQSYSLYKQQFGRMLRPFEGKEYGVLLDHVGNTIYMMTQHGLTYPHDDPDWTLERGTKRAKSDDGEKLAECITCTECAHFYIAKDNDCCPDCGHVITEDEAQAKVREIQNVSGELVELSVEAMEQLIEERKKVDMPVAEFSNRVRNMPNVARYSAMNRHAKRQHAQTILRDRIQRWCVHTAITTGWNKDTVQREFNVKFKVPIAKACTLSEREATELTERIPYYAT